MFFTTKVNSKIIKDVLPLANYAKLDSHENSFLEQSTQPMTKWSQLRSGNITTASKAVIYNNDIVSPPAWNIDMNSVPFRIHTKL